VNLPPLRDREGDIPLLAQHFLSEFASEHGAEPKYMTPDAVAALEAYHWPGNIRELKNVVERAAVLSDDSVITAEHLVIQHRTSRPATRAVATIGSIDIPPGGKSLDDIEREAIRLTLDLTSGNQSAAARILGISWPTLSRKLRRYGLRANGAETMDVAPSAEPAEPELAVPATSWPAVASWG
jgi:DNA-binding NtrC family response regulator